MELAQLVAGRVDRVTVAAHRADAVLLVLHDGVATAEDKRARPDFDGDPAGMPTWHSNIRASISTTDAADVTSRSDAIEAVLRAWLARTPR